MKKILAIFLLMLSLSATANNDLQIALDSPTSDKNYAQAIIDFLTYGHAPESNSSMTLLGNTSHSINVSALVIMGWLSVVGGITFVIHTANKGTPGGKVISSFWMPIRITVATILLIPLSSGYSTIQYGIHMAASTGNQIGDYAMNSAIEHIYNNGNYLPPALPDSKQLIASWIASEVCAQYINSYMNNDTIKAVYRTEYESGSAKSRLSYDWIGESTSGVTADPRLAYCGSVSIQIPREIVPDKASYNYSAPEIIESSFKRIVAEFQPRVSAIASRVISDESALRNLQRNGVSGQSSFETISANVDTQIKGAADEYLSIASGFNSRIATSIVGAVNEISDKNTVASWREEISDIGWVGFGGIFWKSNQLQSHINNLARIMTLRYDAPKPDKEFSGDERFKEMSMRLSGLEKFARENATDRSSMLDNAVVISIESAGVDGSGDQIKTWLASGATAIVRSVVLGSTDADMITSMQYSGSIISTVGEVLYLAIATGEASAEALKESTKFAAQNLANSVSQLPLVGAFFGSVASAGGTPLVSVATFVGTLAQKLLDLASILVAPLIIAGFVLAVVLPAIPIFFWIIGAVSWVLFYIEALLVSPLWMAAHGTAEKEGWGTEHTRQGYMLVAALIIGPLLKVAGFAGCLLFVRLLALPVDMFSSYIQGVMVTGALSPLLLVGPPILMAILAYQLAIRAFSIPNEMHDRGLRWVNGGQAVTGDEQSVGAIRANVGVFNNKTESAAGVAKPKPAGIVIPPKTVPGGSIS